MSSPFREGPVLGVLMLDTAFHRLPGDIGNPATWDFPVLFRTVAGASPAAVVHRRADGLLDAFVAAGRALVADGARGIATSCGFMALWQRELAAALPVPVASSALLQAPLIEAMLPAGSRVGILTYDAAALTPAHLEAVGVARGTPIEGMPPDSKFHAVYGGRLASAAPDALEADAVAAARRLADRCPEVGAILCECTNLPPHSAAIARATGLPVYDVVGFLRWFAAGLQPATW